MVGGIGSFVGRFVRRRGGSVLVAVCCAVLTVAATLPYANEGPLIVAHRGASGNAPENTMAAFELAARLGADYIEFDVQLSKDGELVVIHDRKVDRTTAYKGFVRDYTLQELQAMDAGSFYDKDYAEETIHSFDEVMNRFAGRLGILIEIKDPELYPGIEEKLAEKLRRYEGMANGRGLKANEGIMVQSFDFESMRHMHDLLPGVPVAVLVHKDQHPLSDKKLDDLASYVTYINYNQKLLDEQMVWSIHGRNMKVMAWTIKKGRDMKRMKRLRVDGVIGNYVGLG
ncbi:glycerophosphodiester phosphodiesterase [Paenibacillus nasutitermitis]|uniref:Glycerophosphoryl diester phosphodiesterase YhdW n=1 Tax=Paenibacillus nasutitermitis TaxID=1652958 RepID=A0A916ZDI7_9BACL|nr:glycerophosphodiester phosphodiesterase family protein [Paenibacillus nasutitermitis]GGD89730.1 putative glycerophosphoryl diester phosphodiesterase YhdW [Paenibacillus nasutitermitis]